MRHHTALVTLRLDHRFSPLHFATQRLHHQLPRTRVARAGVTRRFRQPTGAHLLNGRHCHLLRDRLRRLHGTRTLPNGHRHLQIVANTIAHQTEHVGTQRGRRLSASGALTLAHQTAALNGIRKGLPNIVALNLHH